MGRPETIIRHSLEENLTNVMVIIGQEFDMNKYRQTIQESIWDLKLFPMKANLSRMKRLQGRYNVGMFVNKVAFYRSGLIT